MGPLNQPQQAGIPWRRGRVARYSALSAATRLSGAIDGSIEGPPPLAPFGLQLTGARGLPNLNASRSRSAPCASAPPPQPRPYSRSLQTISINNLCISKQEQADHENRRHHTSLPIQLLEESKHHRASRKRPVPTPISPRPRSTLSPLFVRNASSEEQCFGGVRGGKQL
jgi:hypothetical protein